MSDTHVSDTAVTFLPLFADGAHEARLDFIATRNTSVDRGGGSGEGKGPAQGPGPLLPEADLDADLRGRRRRHQGIRRTARVEPEAPGVLVADGRPLRCRRTAVRHLRAARGWTAVHLLRRLPGDDAGSGGTGAERHDVRAAKLLRPVPDRNDRRHLDRLRRGQRRRPGLRVLGSCAEAVSDTDGV